MSTSTTVVVQENKVASLDDKRQAHQAVQQANANKPSLMGMTLEQLTELMKGLDEPAFRAKQIFQWMYVKNVRDFREMKNVSKATQEKLEALYTVGRLTCVDKQVSQDGTTKYLFQTPTGHQIESVLMYFDDRDAYSICISSQVGCAVDCSFCATGKLGFKENLTVADIVDQFLYVQHDCGRDIRNIVYMGQGEPLLNYDNVLGSVRLLNTAAEVGIRHITISTSGIVPKIDQLGDEGLQIVLAVSLHAPDDETRNKFMPINKKWPVKTLVQSIHRYVEKTGRRVTIEYILLKGINDSVQHAKRLGALLSSLKCNINLIPYNPIGMEYDFERPTDAAIVSFMRHVSDYGKKVTVRVERGTDIAAACGQLANQYQQKRREDARQKKSETAHASKP